MNARIYTLVLLMCSLQATAAHQLDNQFEQVPVEYNTEMLRATATIVGAQVEDIRDVKMPSVSEVAAVCAAMTGVVFNHETLEVTFTPNPWWEQFSTVEEMAETRRVVSLVLRDAPEMIDTYIEGAEKCALLKKEALEAADAIEEVHEGHDH